METRETMIKRLKMRSMRRGIKEMDLILTAFATARLEAMSDQDLVHYDRFMAESDHDLYNWISGLPGAPEEFSDLISEISAMAAGLTRPR